MIFLISGKAESGKSTLAKYLTTEIANANYASYCIPFAGAVKKIAKEMGWDGNKDEKGRNLLQFIHNTTNSSNRVVYFFYHLV